MRYVIIGNSAAGLAAVAGIRRRDREGAIALISDEPHQAYSRILITYLIAGQVQPAGMVYRDPGFYQDYGVELVLGARAETVDPAAQVVRTADGRTWPYDRLLLATGAAAVRPRVEGWDLPGVFVMRTLTDAYGVLARLPQAREAVVVGGGLVSLKTAEALVKRGLKVTMVVSSPQLLSQTMDATAAGVIQQRAEAWGVDVRTGDDVVAFAGRGELERVVLRSGEELPCQIAVVGKGVRPNADLAAAAGLEVDRGIKVDHYLATTIPNIYAAGDVAQAPSLLEEGTLVAGVWSVAVEQGYIAGLNMAGSRQRYPGALKRNSGRFFGLEAASVGLTVYQDDRDFAVTTLGPTPGGKYRRLVFRGDRLVGAVLLGDIRQAGLMTRLIVRGLPVSQRSLFTWADSRGTVLGAAKTLSHRG